MDGLCNLAGTGMRTAQTYGTLYCSTRQNWKSLATEPTDAEKKSGCMPEGCFGVFRGTNAYNQPYGMWMVHRDSPHDPKGFVFGAK